MSIHTSMKDQKQILRQNLIRLYQLIRRVPALHCDFSRDWLDYNGLYSTSLEPSLSEYRVDVH